MNSSGLQYRQGIWCIVLLIRIQSTVQVAYHIMIELDQLVFARPLDLTSETMLSVSKNAFKG